MRINFFWRENEECLSDAGLYLVLAALVVAMVFVLVMLL